MRNKKCLLRWSVGICVALFCARLYLLDLANPDAQEHDQHALQWYWSIYSNRTTGSSSKKVLIAQQSGNVEYYRTMLDITQRANRGYARHCHFDYVALTGLALGGYQNYHANFNKIQVLQRALFEGYDAVLLLDADAFVHKVDHDLQTDIDYYAYHNYALAASTTHKENSHSWKFNAGVLLWNLNHPKAASIVQLWERLARISIYWDLQSVSERLSGDQTLLNILVWWHNYRPKPIIETTQGTLNFVRHVMRRFQDRFRWELPPGNNSSSKTDGEVLDERTARLKKLVSQVCQQQRKAGSLFCEDIPTRLE